MRHKTLTCSLHIGGKQVETLTEEQRQRLTDKFAAAVNLYFTAHLEEFMMLKTDAGKES